MDQIGGLLTVADTAHLLQRSTEQVRRYLREGALAGRRVGGQWFIARADAQEFLTRRRESSEFAKRLLSSDRDPLGAVIAIGRSRGGNIAAGRNGYLRSFSGAR
jgi:hypothetical protein